MSQLERLYDLLSKPELCKKYFGENCDFSSKFISYQFENATLTLTVNNTGFEEKQVFETEELTWHPFIYKNKACLVSSPTKSRLILSGETGYYLGSQDLNQYADMYSNKMFRTTVVSMTNEIFNALPNELQEVSGCYWVIDTYESYLDYNVFGIQYIECGFPSNEGDFLFDSNGLVYVSSNQIRLVALLPDDVMVEVSNSKLDGSSKDTALRLYASPPSYTITADDMDTLKNLAENAIETILSNETDEDIKNSSFRSLKAILELLDNCNVI